MSNDQETSLVELKTIENEIKLLIGAYDVNVKDYILHVRNNQPDKANEILPKIQENNDIIFELFKQAEKIKSELSKNRLDDDSSHVLFDEDLLNISKTLKMNEDKVQRLARELKSIDGVNASATKETLSNRVKYLFMMILVIVVVCLTIRAFMFEPKMIDTILLVTALLLGVFHFFNKQV
tara:strand:+ start:3486 stop:4025 length:540 start_codon:yes stop_codon:yes gene_type:complete